MKGSFPSGGPLAEDVDTHCRKLGGKACGYSLHASLSDGHASGLRFLVVFEDEPGPEAISRARGYIQWFVSEYLGYGKLRDIETKQIIEPMLPEKAFFLVDHDVDVVHYAGTQADIDLSLCKKAVRVAIDEKWPDWRGIVDLYFLYEAVADA